MVTSTDSVVEVDSVDELQLPASILEELEAVNTKLESGAVQKTLGH